jgi:hypothetical protein
MFSRTNQVKLGYGKGNGQWVEDSIRSRQYDNLKRTAGLTKGWHGGTRPVLLICLTAVQAKPALRQGKYKTVQNHALARRARSNALTLQGSACKVAT